MSTVLFADLVGSTALGGELDPELVRDLLDRFYDAMAAEVALGGGTLEKFIGDAVVAVFGAPVAQEDHAERALFVALSMRSRLRGSFGERLQLRIGVNTGEVVVGRPRERSSFVTGDAVNVAARLEQAASPGQILVGERTVAAVGSAFDFAEPVVVQAKGKLEGIGCRELSRMTTTRRPYGGGALGSTFVGRERELASLEDAYQRACRTNAPWLATLVGEVGVGKSSLVARLRERLSERALFRLGRCTAYGRGVAYSPLAEVLRQHVELRESDPPEAALDRLPGQEVLGLTLGLDIAGDLDPRAAQEHLHAAWVRLLTECATRQPTVLVVEDLHWAAEPLLELLSRILDEVTGTLLLLTTARPGPRRLSARGDTLLLQALTPAEASTMLDRLLGGELGSVAREVVLHQAGGNPFFMEELLSSLIDQGRLERVNGGWSLRGGGTLTVPDSVQAVLAARIDLLPAAEKDALQAAAVIGRSFTPDALTVLTGATRVQVQALVDRDFVRPAGKSELVFKHALSRDVAYASLPKVRRAQLHATLATWLESRVADRDDQAPVLAHHYAEATAPDAAELAWRGEEARLARLRASAVRWLHRAAHLAIRRYDVEEGLTLLRRALALEPPAEVQAGIWRAIGGAHALRYEGSPLLEAMQRAVDLTEDPAIKAEILGELALETVNRYGMLNPMPPRDLVDGWIDQALRLAAPGSPARARALVARGCWFGAGTAAAADEADAITERLPDVGLRSYALAAQSGTALAAGHFSEAEEFSRKRLALLDRISDPDHIVDIYSTAIAPLLARGRFEPAREFVRLHDAAASRLSTHHQLHAVAYWLEFEHLRGAWGTIRSLGARTEKAVALNSVTVCIRNAHSLLTCSVASACLGDGVEAHRFEELAEEWKPAGFDWFLAHQYLNIGIARGDLATVERYLEVPRDPPPPKGGNWYQLAMRSARLDALATLGRRHAVEADAPPLIVADTYLEPFALRALGRVREDDTLMHAAAARFAALGLEWHAQQTIAWVREHQTR